MIMEKNSDNKEANSDVSMMNKSSASQMLPTQIGTHDALTSAGSLYASSNQPVVRATSTISVSTTLVNTNKKVSPLTRLLVEPDDVIEMAGPGQPSSSITNADKGSIPLMAAVPGGEKLGIWKAKGFDLSTIPVTAFLSEELTSKKTACNSSGNEVVVPSSSPSMALGLVQQSSISSSSFSLASRGVPQMLANQNRATGTGSSKINNLIGPLLLQALDGFVFTIRPNGVIDFVSENITQYLGFQREKLEDNSIFNILHRDDHSSISNLLDRLKAIENDNNPDNCSEKLLLRLLLKKKDDSSGNDYVTLPAQVLAKNFRCDLPTTKDSAASEIVTDMWKLVMIICRTSSISSQVPISGTSSTSTSYSGGTVNDSKSSIAVSKATALHGDTESSQPGSVCGSISGSLLSEILTEDVPNDLMDKPGFLPDLDPLSLEEILNQGGKEMATDRSTYSNVSLSMTLPPNITSYAVSVVSTSPSLCGLYRQSSGNFHRQVCPVRASRGPPPVTIPALILTKEGGYTIPGCDDGHPFSNIIITVQDTDSQVYYYECYHTERKLFHSDEAFDLLNCRWRELLSTSDVPIWDKHIQAVLNVKPESKDDQLSSELYRTKVFGQWMFIKSYSSCCVEHQASSISKYIVSYHSIIRKLHNDCELKGSANTSFRNAIAESRRCKLGSSMSTFMQSPYIGSSAAPMHSQPPILNLPPSSQGLPCPQMQTSPHIQHSYRHQTPQPTPLGYPMHIHHQQQFHSQRPGMPPPYSQQQQVMTSGTGGIFPRGDNPENSWRDQQCHNRNYSGSGVPVSSANLAHTWNVMSSRTAEFSPRTSITSPSTTLPVVSMSSQALVNRSTANSSASYSSSTVKSLPFTSDLANDYLSLLGSSQTGETHWSSATSVSSSVLPSYNTATSCMAHTSGSARLKSTNSMGNMLHGSGHQACSTGSNVTVVTSGGREDPSGQTMSSTRPDMLSQPSASHDDSNLMRMTGHTLEEFFPGLDLHSRHSTTGAAQPMTMEERAHILQNLPLEAREKIKSLYRTITSREELILQVRDVLVDYIGIDSFSLSCQQYRKRHQSKPHQQPSSFIRSSSASDSLGVMASLGPVVQSPEEGPGSSPPQVAQSTTDSEEDQRRLSSSPQSLAIPAPSASIIAATSSAEGVNRRGSCPSVETLLKDSGKVISVAADSQRQHHYSGGNVGGQQSRRSSYIKNNSLLISLLYENNDTPGSSDDHKITPCESSSSGGAGNVSSTQSPPSTDPVTTSRIPGDHIRGRNNSGSNQTSTPRARRRTSGSGGSTRHQSGELLRLLDSSNASSGGPPSDTSVFDFNDPAGAHMSMTQIPRSKTPGKKRRTSNTQSSEAPSPKRLGINADTHQQATSTDYIFPPLGSISDFPNADRSLTPGGSRILSHLLSSGTAADSPGLSAFGDISPGTQTQLLKEAFKRPLDNLKTTNATPHIPGPNLIDAAIRRPKAVTSSSPAAQQASVAMCYSLLDGAATLADSDIIWDNFDHLFEGSGVDLDGVMLDDVDIQGLISGTESVDSPVKLEAGMMSGETLPSGNSSNRTESNQLSTHQSQAQDVVDNLDVLDQVLRDEEAGSSECHHDPADAEVEEVNRIKRQFELDVRRVPGAQTGQRVEGSGLQASISSHKDAIQLRLQQEQLRSQLRQQMQRDNLGYFGSGLNSGGPPSTTGTFMGPRGGNGALSARSLRKPVAAFTHFPVSQDQQRHDYQHHVILQGLMPQFRDCLPNAVRNNMGSVGGSPMVSSGIGIARSTSGAPPSGLSENFAKLMKEVGPNVSIPVPGPQQQQGIRPRVPIQRSSAIASGPVLPMQQHFSRTMASQWGMVSNQLDNSSVRSTRPSTGMPPNVVAPTQQQGPIGQGNYPSVGGLSTAVASISPVQGLTSGSVHSSRLVKEGLRQKVANRSVGQHVGTSSTGHQNSPHHSAVLQALAHQQHQKQLQQQQFIQGVPIRPHEYSTFEQGLPPAPDYQQHVAQYHNAPPQSHQLTGVMLSDLLSAPPNQLIRTDNFPMQQQQQESSSSGLVESALPDHIADCLFDLENSMYSTNPSFSASSTLPVSSNTSSVYQVSVLTGSHQGTKNNIERSGPGGGSIATSSALQVRETMSPYFRSPPNATNSSGGSRTRRPSAPRSNLPPPTLASEGGSSSIDTANDASDAAAKANKQTGLLEALLANS